MPKERRFNIEGRNLTAKEMCKEKSIPKNVYEWRLSKGMSGVNLTRESDTLYYYQGVAYTARMVEEIFGVNRFTLLTRYKEGKRDADLFKSVASNGQDAEKIRALKLERECKAHVDALVKHHPEKARPVVQNLDDFEAARAVRNAARLVSAGRGSLVSQNDYLWSVGQ